MNQKGATLIELVLSIVVLGIIAYIVTDTFVYSSRSILTGNQARDATQSGRLAIDRMSREIRNIRDDNCVSTATNNMLSFVDANNNTIAYSWGGAAGNPLMRNGNVLVDSVNNLTFAYYDNANPPNAIAGPATCAAPCSSTCAPTNIWSVSINLTTQSGTQMMNFRSQVHPLNF
jgi:type II secretory pathway pseudopilin PulG